MTQNRQNRIKAIEAELKKGSCDKYDLMNMFDVRSERAIRQDIDYIRSRQLVIAVSKKKGYKIPSSIEDLTHAKQTVAEAKSRAREALKGVKKLERWIAEVENG